VVNLNEVEKQIKSDASLVYRLLALLELLGLLFHRGNPLGAACTDGPGGKQIRKWVALVVTLHAGAAASTELIRTALTRARFCESLAPHVSGGSEDLFFSGSCLCWM